MNKSYVEFKEKRNRRKKVQTYKMIGWVEFCVGFLRSYFGIIINNALSTVSFPCCLICDLLGRVL